MLRSADVAKMLPCVPAAMTATEATNTMKSAGAGMVRSGRRQQPNPPASETRGWGFLRQWGHGGEEGGGPLSVCQQPGSGSDMGSGCQPWGLGVTGQVKGQRGNRPYYL